MTAPSVEQWIKAGEVRQAAAWLVTSYGPDVLTTCIAMVGDRAAAEDVTQDVFSDAFRALAGFRGESSPRTWLLSIARNRCIDYLRARKRDPWARAGGDAGADGDSGADQGDPDTHPDQTAAGPDWFADRAALLRALDALAEGDRALITLRFRNGLEYDELATAFGLKEGTVRMRVSRALARMREVLGPEAEGAAAARLAGAAAVPARAPAPPPAPASRARVARVEAAGGAMRGGAPPAAPGAPGPSWWSRLKGWAGGAGGAVRQPPSASAPFVPSASLGVALAACVPVAMSDALAARLGTLVDGLPST